LEAGAKENPLLGDEVEKAANGDGLSLSVVDENAPNGDV